RSSVRGMAGSFCPLRPDAAILGRTRCQRQRTKSLGHAVDGGPIPAQDAGDLTGDLQVLPGSDDQAPPREIRVADLLIAVGAGVPLVVHVDSKEAEPAGGA